ncbi:glycosyltransferase involved in cell wall biosynthesis [Deinobacterium chartae]|uniref:Glycosyltransferase involved in cell wall biosynthesis n=1 Tax=Deinobacterium chartae TaxID=521158 RepID=A0A841I022_9DEIO|nr:glycosyltransferase family 2 protein [Deinobacterium chartae]MBB6097789.1 glycosyltransferase involved in cell wall biosynthesis [Deinobacterium chartae]
MGASTLDAAVIIPAYNEQETVGRVVEAARVLNVPVVVVSDGSKDKTAEVARAAGAQVVDLSPNRGKGGAIAAGLEATDATFVLLLDADLVGLTREHLESLLLPVVRGELDMTIGVFRSGGLLTDFGNRATPHLSGQRACRREWLQAVPHLAEERWPEPAITEHLRRSGANWRYVPLLQVSQVMKEIKRGFWSGLKHRAKMYRDLVSYRARRREPSES